MQLPKSVHKNLAKEFRIAADMMGEATDLRSKLYFFSALFGAVNRAFNEVWVKELSLLHLVLQTTHGTIDSRVNQMMAAREPSIEVVKEIPEALTKAADELASVFASDNIDDSTLFGILVRLSTLTYATTGNGYYLYRKGQLKI